ncbi:MAG: N-acyl-D-amino-acid deacylase family protein [Acidimicrobiales bacterium]
MLDLVIKGGTVIDGSGRPGIRADVAIKDGRVVKIGEVTQDSAKTIDATGKIVAPGFIDIHTHYDAQVFWDGNLSPSPLHGITTVIGGNCGFTIAPLEMDSGDYLMKMLSRVEGMPLTSLETGVPWGTWRSFGEWLNLLEGTLAVNAGFMVGHSALRRNAMGERSVGNHANDTEMDHMKRSLAESLEAGGLGFTSSWATSHNDAQGDPVPSRHASREEMIALAGVCRDFDGTQLEFIPTVGRFEQHHIELLTDMSLAANRAINWNLIAVNLSPKQQEVMHNRLAATDYARARGAEVLALTVPCAVQSRLCLESGFTFDMLNGWAKPMALPVDDKMRLLSDPSTRRELAELAQGPSPMRGLAKWHKYTIGEVFSSENQEYTGRSIGDIAEAEGREPFDVLCEIAVADRLKTGLYQPVVGDDRETWEKRVEVWRDTRTIVGGTDAGAHLDLLATFNATTAMLGRACRELKLLPWEEAIALISDAPARQYGLHERGRLQEGWHADVVVIDPQTVGARPVEIREDLPGGAWRLYGEADGIDHVVVNGTEICRNGEFTGAKPGGIMRSGRDTVGTAIS